MYNAGNPSKAHVADAYLSYRCSDSTLCVLVTARSGYVFASNEAWIKIYDGDNSEQDFVEGFQYIYDGENVVAWEGCTTALPATPFVSSIQMEIHANWGPASGGGTGNTASTGKKNSDDFVSLDLDCGCGNSSDCPGVNECTEASCDSGVCVYTDST